MTGEVLKVGEGYQDRVPLAAYLQDGALDGSGIKSMLRTPAHYMCEQMAPSEQTEPMLLGSAFHTLLLEPQLFDELYAVSAFGDRRGKKWPEFKEANAGKDALLPQQFVRLEAMVERLRAHETADALLQNGVAERSFWWVDKKTGVRCKCRPDYYRESDNIVLNIKTTADAGYYPFQRVMHSLKYHMSAAFTMQGVRAVTGKKPRAWIAVVIEQHPPYAIALYCPDRFALEVGTQEYRKGIELYDKCSESGTWPGYPLDIQSIALPSWAK